MKRIILVTGGRRYWPERTVWDALDRIWPDLVIAGDALGADRFAHQWAAERRVDRLTAYAWWDELQNAAGPQRNGRMARGYAQALLRGLFDQAIVDGKVVNDNLDSDAACLWFPGNTGTADCKKQASAAGLTLLEGERVANSSIPLAWPWEGRMLTDLPRRNPAWPPL